MKRYRSPFATAFASLVAVSLAAVACAQTPTTATASSIPWSDVTGDAFAASHRTGKPILVYVTAEKCAFCRKMEKETWSDPRVAQADRTGFVPLKLHADTHP